MKKIFYNRVLFIKTLFTLLCVLLSFDYIYSQTTGSISGSVTDALTGEKLISASVQVLGTKIGTMTDIDGQFFIKNLKPGTYSLKISYVSYSALIIENIIVKAGSSSKVDIQLTQETTKMQEVIVSAEKINNNENAILRIQKSSINIVDGLSSELIKKNNSSDGSEALKRMTGITISDGKYAFIRGIGDRYNNTQLNESNLPSTDPEKKSFSYDIIPSNIIENLITSKTFTPDKPGDFSGGLIQIKTIEFPQNFILGFSASGTYNTTSSLRDFTSYEGGSKDNFGYDDGTRALPSIITNKVVTRGNYSDEELKQIGLAFKNNWNTKKSKAPVNGSYKISLGDRFSVNTDDIMGYVLSLTYSKSYEIKNFENNNYTFEIPRYQYSGVNNNKSIMLSGLLNFGYKFAQNHKFSFNNVINQVSDDDITTVKGNYYYTSQLRDVTSLRYLSRSLYSTQLTGEHFFELFKGLNFDWNLNYSVSKRDEPDARRYVYARDMYDSDEPMRFLLDQSISTRFYGNLKDKNYGLSSNFLLKTFDGGLLPDFKFGLNVNFKDRNFAARSFGFKNVAGGDFVKEEEVLLKPVHEIFIPENFGNKFIEIVEITKPSDSYTSDQLVTSLYLMSDYKFGNLRMVTGVRYEKSIQNLHTMTQTGEKLDVQNKYNDFLPAFILTYSLSESSNLRFAFSNTLARPEFREIAPFSYFDFITNEIVIGNKELKRSKISNLDLRYEFYPSLGEIMSLSLFYKYFNMPIEEILLASSGFEPIRSYENSKSAQNLGLEIEIRKNFGFINNTLSNLSFISNITFIKSTIKLNRNGFQDNERPLQGQAPWIINLGLYYDDIQSGFSANILYNRLGDKISKVGYAGLGDIIEKGRDQVDLSFSKNLFGYFNLKVLVKDILSQDLTFIQKTKSEDKIAQVYKRGRIVSLGLSYDVK